MLKLEEKEYDLNFLCSFTFDFQMLKDILIKLAKSNIEMQDKLNDIEKTNKEKEKRLSAIEDQLNILYIPEHNSESEGNEEDSQKENTEKKDNEDKKEITMEEKDNNIKPIIKTEKKIDKENNNLNEPKQRNSINYSLTRPFQNYDKRSSFVQQFPQVSHDTIKSLLKLIRENAEKMNKLEKNLTKRINDAITDFERKYDDLNDENEKDHKIFKQKIKEINDKLYDYNDKMDGIIIKTAPLDTLTIFRDNGKSDIDATKVMVKMLEEKVSKRIEKIEKTNKEENDEGKKYKEKLKELEAKIDLLNKELIKQREENKNIGDNNNINDNNEEIQKLKDLIDNKYNEVLKIIDELSIKIKNGDLLGDKLQELINKMKSEKDNISNNDEPIQDCKQIDAKIIDKINGNISELKDRIKELNKKINDNDNHYKNLLNNSSQEIGEIYKKLNEINSILETKISKDDFKILQNKINEHDDIIKFLQGEIADLNQSIKKLIENNPSFVKRLEELTHEIMQLKERETKEIPLKSIEQIKTLDENKLKEILKIMSKNIEDLVKEKKHLLDSIKEINESIQLFETKERVNKLEDDLNTRISDIIATFNKKFIDRVELNKFMRSIDIKLKSLDTPHKERDSESWILAKQPVGCFNCASCESNIKNTNSSTDYIPWNKYPQAERQYHIGQGFSHLLKKLGNDNFNLNDIKEKYTENELGYSNNFNNSSYIKGNNGHFIFNAINRESLKRDFPDKGFRLTKGYKLPNVKNKRKKNENLPLTDDEDSNSNSLVHLTNSPKIMKITKKNVTGNFIDFKTQQKTSGIETNFQKMNSTSMKPKVKLDRIKSLPIFDNP